METSRRTVMVLELEHKGDLPADLEEKLQQRIYDYCSTKGLTVVPSIRTGYELKIREQ